MNISQILPIQSTGVRTALALSSVLFRSLVEADEVRKEEEARGPTPEKVFEETCAQSGIPLTDLDVALAEFMGGGADAAAKIADLRTVAARNPDLGTFLQMFAVKLASETPEQDPPTAPPPPAAPPPPPTSKTTPSASSATHEPGAASPASRAPSRPRFRPEFAPGDASEVAETTLAERLGQIEDALLRLQRDQTSLRAHVHTELSTKRLIERVERLHEELTDAQGRVP